MKKLATGLGVTLVIIGIAAVYLWRELDTQRQLNAAAVTRVTALESMHPAESVVASGVAGMQAAAVMPAPAAQAGQVSTAPAARGQSASRSANPLLAQAGQLRNSPEGREFQRVMMRQMLEQQYPDLAKTMNLSPENAGKLLDLLVKQRIDLAADRLSLQPGEEMARSLARKEQAYEAELSAMLGSSYTKWQEYQRTAMERQQAEYARVEREDMRNAISSGNAPLTDAQFQYLDSALAAEQKRIDQESRGMSLQQQLQRMPETNRRLAEVAAAHLNPQQLDRYKRYLEQQEEMAHAIDAMGATR